jgi:hypothetical protein
MKMIAPPLHLVLQDILDAKLNIIEALTTDHCVSAGRPLATLLSIAHLIMLHAHFELGIDFIEQASLH